MKASAATRFRYLTAAVRPWLGGGLAVFLSMSFTLWLLTLPAVFRPYYSALVPSPHLHDAVKIVEWLRSAYREQSLQLVLADGHLTQKELRHYSDVRRLIRWPVRIACGLLLATALLVLMQRPSAVDLRATLRCGLILWSIFVILAHAAAWWDWRTTFAWLHEPFFAGRSWRFPKGAYSLRLFPQTFWQVTFSVVLAGPAVGFGLVGLCLRFYSTFTRSSDGTIRPVAEELLNADSAIACGRDSRPPAPAGKTHTIP